VRRGFVLLLLCGLGLSATGALIFVERPSTDTLPLYTVAQVTQGLAQHPRAWSGRAVLVRGRIIAYSYMTRDQLTGQGDCTTPDHVCSLPIYLSSFESGTNITVTMISLVPRSRTNDTSATALPLTLTYRFHPSLGDNMLHALQQLPIIGSLPQLSQEIVMRGQGVYHVQILLMPSNQKPSGINAVLVDGPIQRYG